MLSTTQSLNAESIPCRGAPDFHPPRRLCDSTDKARWLRFTVGPVVQLICVTDAGDELNSIPVVIFTLRGVCVWLCPIHVSGAPAGCLEGCVMNRCHFVAALLGTV